MQNCRLWSLIRFFIPQSKNSNIPSRIQDTHGRTVKPYQTRNLPKRFTIWYKTSAYSTDKYRTSENKKMINRFRKRSAKIRDENWNQSEGCISKLFFFHPDRLKVPTMYPQARPKNIIPYSEIVLLVRWLKSGSAGPTTAVIKRYSDGINDVPSRKYTSLCAGLSGSVALLRQKTWLDRSFRPKF